MAETLILEPAEDTKAYELGDDPDLTELQIAVDAIWAQKEGDEEAGSSGNGNGSGTPGEALPKLPKRIGKKARQEPSPNGKPEPKPKEE